MKQAITFNLDGNDVEAAQGESIWQSAKRHSIDIPHLCHLPEPGYHADGNCRACVVEIEGERVLAPSCSRMPAPGMVVKTSSKRVQRARKTVFELLLADQPARDRAHDRNSRFWYWIETLGIESSPFPARQTTPAADASHPAMGVNLDACIHCNLCVRACREVQVNDVIGMSGRGAASKIVFDVNDPMGDSSCVACGECVQACPTGALMPAALLDSAQVGERDSDQLVDSICPYCGVGCQMTYHLMNGKIRHIEGLDGPANEKRLCVKGRFGFDYIEHPHRLTKPLIRKDGVAKSGTDTVDPANPLTHFREASWEEALEYAANGLRRLRDKHGPKSLAGFGSAKCSNEEAYLFQKLVRSVFGSNNVDHCTRLCHASSVSALIEGVGSGAVTAPFYDALKADCIIVIGTRPTENHPVAATYFKQASKNGATLILMDPRGSGLARHTNHHLKFTGGTDVALLNAMLHVIVTEDLIDRDFIYKHTEGFEALAERIKNYPPEEMSSVCGIDANTIRTVARTYATSGRSMIFWGMGVSQHSHGTDNARCLIALALATGHIGRPGTGLHPLRGQNNVQGASDAGLIPMFFPDYKSVADPDVRARFENAWQTPLDPDPGLTVVETMNAIHAGDVKGMYIMGENPAMSDPDLNHARGALAKLEHLVVQDIFLTETAFHADVVLPATAWSEKSGTVTNTNREVQMGRPAGLPPGEARPDWQITRDIANRMDGGWNYESPADIFAEMKSVMTSLDNLTWQRLDKEGAVTYPCDDPNGPGKSVIFGDGFPTTSGRARFVPADLKPPAEMPDDDYPMVLTTGRMLEHWHTGAMTRRASALSAITPEAHVSMNPLEMEQLGLKPGDRAQVSTRRGEIELCVKADPDLAKGMIFIPFFYAEAAANILTNPVLDPFGKIPEFKFCAASLRKLE
ncbi:MAG: formate dehydrogenase subunit alpha [Alphaproteobacteria bacterium]|jgi:formate dehydrogenase major subunit|nr:formate dehydrogenase subunit alpha [Alphaproteobacteria bacterium]MBT6240440.1 formate dehydrogenase subunit alpha [Rhodospirillaceae bacterium]